MYLLRDAQDASPCSRTLPRLRIRKLISFSVELSILNGESLSPGRGGLSHPCLGGNLSNLTSDQVGTQPSTKALTVVARLCDAIRDRKLAISNFGFSAEFVAGKATMGLQRSSFVGIRRS